MAPRVRLDHGATANRHARRRQTQNKQVAARQRDWVLEPDLHPGLLARLQLVPIEQRQFAERLGGAGVEADFGIVTQRVRIADQTQPSIQRARRLQRAGRAQDLAPTQIFDREAAQVDCRSGPGRDRLEFFAVALQPADSGFESAGLDLELLTEMQLTVNQGAGDDRAEAGHGEDTVNRQSRATRVRAHTLSAEQVLDDVLKRVEAGASGGRARHDGHAFE